MAQVLFKAYGSAFTKDIFALGNLEWYLSQSYLVSPAITSLAFSACSIKHCLDTKFAICVLPLTV